MLTSSPHHLLTPRNTSTKEKPQSQKNKLPFPFSEEGGPADYQEQLSDLGDGNNRSMTYLYPGP